MSVLTRRHIVAGAVVATCAASKPALSAEAATPAQLARLDRKASAALNFLQDTVPESRDLVDLSSGMLIMPLITKAAFLLGGAYGEGVLRVGGETVDYFSSFQVNYGFQFSAQQYSYALFFLNDRSLGEFMNSKGWTFGAESKYLIIDDTEIHRADTLTSTVDVAGMVFGAAGLHIGASLDGTKFSRMQRAG